MHPSSMRGYIAICAAQNSWQLSCCQRELSGLELPGFVARPQSVPPTTTAIFCVHLVEGTVRLTQDVLVIQ